MASCAGSGSGGGTLAAVEREVRDQILLLLVRALVELMAEAGRVELLAVRLSRSQKPLVSGDPTWVCRWSIRLSGWNSIVGIRRSLAAGLAPSVE